MPEDEWDDLGYLDRTYDGAPDECGWHFRNSSEILKFVGGECPKSEEHPQYC